MLCPAAMASAVLLLLAVAGVVSIRPATAKGIKQESVKDDPRRSILIDRFSYDRDGLVSISVTGAKVSSMHRVLLASSSSPDEALFEAISPEPPWPMDLYPNPESSSQNCILDSPYIIPLVTFLDLDGEGHFNKTFPITHADE